MLWVSAAGNECEICSLQQASAGDVRASSAAAGAMAALLPLLPGHANGQQGLRSGRASNEALPADLYVDRSIAGLQRLLVRKDSRLQEIHHPIDLLRTKTFTKHDDSVSTDIWG